MACHADQGAHAALQPVVAVGGLLEAVFEPLKAGTFGSEQRAVLAGLGYGWALEQCERG